MYQVSGLNPGLNPGLAAVLCCLWLPVLGSGIDINLHRDGIAVIVQNERMVITLIWGY